MAKTTTYLQTPYPEAQDLADIPKNMRDIAVNWENAWAGQWIDWNPVVTQSATGLQVAMVIDPASTHARVRKIGRTVYVQAHIVVLTGTTQSGYPQIFLPYPMANINTPLGSVSYKQGTGQGRNIGFASTYSPNLGNTSVVEIFGNSTARVAADWFGLHLCYETP